MARILLPTRWQWQKSTRKWTESTLQWVRKLADPRRGSAMCSPFSFFSSRTGGLPRVVHHGWMGRSAGCEPYRLRVPSLRIVRGHGWRVCVCTVSLSLSLFLFPFCCACVCVSAFDVYMEGVHFLLCAVARPLTRRTRTMTPSGSPTGWCSPSSVSLSSSLTVSSPGCPSTSFSR